MHISRIRIRNFRNFRRSAFLLQEGVNALIGENGSGKTNAFYAVRLLLDDSLTRRALRLRESDFNRANGDWKGHWIAISVDFENLDTSEGCQVIRHNVGHMDEENRGTYTFFFRPKIEVRKALYTLCREQAGADRIRRQLSEIEIDQYEHAFTGRGVADFLDDSVYARVVGDFDALQFPNPDEISDADVGVTMLQPLHHEVSCTFVKALRDVVGELRSYRDSPLLNLLRGTEQHIEVEDAERIISTVKELNRDISSLSEVRQIAQGVQDTLYDTVGHTYSPNIDVYSGLPEEIDNLFQRLTLKVSDPSDAGYQGDLSELSLGGANLIYLSLKLLEYELKASSDRAAHFLLIEEPEAHIHTHIQKTLFDNYQDTKTQVVVSTHSTHISAASRISRVNILATEGQEAHVYHPSANLSPEQCRRVERYLDAVRSTLLFAKAVMLVEGDAELVLIPALVKKVFGVSLDELGISLINMSSTVFANIAIIFDDQRIRRRCAIVTDSDTSITPLNESEDDDTPFEKSCRASQEAGEERREVLDELCDGNTWLEPFYATHTFEVDYLQAGNVEYVVAGINTILSQEAARTRSAERIRSADVAISGKETLRLAGVAGKGWYALLLAEQVDIDTEIPGYILEAIAFACRETMDLEFVRRMALYRLEDYAKADEDVADVMAKARTGTLQELQEAYSNRLPEDALTSFLTALNS